MRVTLFFVVALAAASTLALAGECGGVGMKAINGVKPDASVFERDKPKVPIQIRTSEELVKVFGKEQAATIQKQVDFKNQLVVVFAWKGSGQDQLLQRILESSPPQYRFTYVDGKTKDLRQHVHVFAIGLNIKWGVSE